MRLLSQVSPMEDLAFHVLMIPVGLYMIRSGRIAIARKEFSLRRRAEPVQGTRAVVSGVITMLGGAVFLGLATWRLLKAFVWGNL
ncbi:hypothetical protein SH668x_001916 [Planctomicrobium sp. SH668]|uniref:hypothetical protein n=1 Tax=Planctomicrobium sp. SH668 TaxID=3448126 RepID=UPI003F5B7BF8